MEHKEIIELTASSWKAKVYIETSEHIIKGFVFMSRTGKKNRMLTEILNASKQFMSGKECTFESKGEPQKEIEQHDFLLVNTTSVLLMRPMYEN